MGRFKDSLWWQIVQLLFVLAVFLIAKSELAITLLFLVLIFVLFKLQYFKGEWKVFVLGVVLGVVLELGGDLIFKLQYWNDASFFGIPLWLPLIWGYEFVFMRRIGNFLVKKKFN